MRTESGGRRRRFAISYALSIALHLCALYVLLATPVELGSTDGGDERAAPAVFVTVSRLQHPAPARPRPVPTVRPLVRIVQHRVIPAAAPAVPAPPAQRELSRPRPRAPLEAQATPSPAQVAAVTTAVPTIVPTQAAPTAAPPTPEPTRPPTAAPTPLPTQPPTPVPTREPTPVPTEPPTAEPTRAPTAAPTQPPTPAPTREPTAAPTAEPTRAPTARPAATPRAIAAATPAAEGGGSATAAPRTPAPVAYAAPTPGPEQRNAAEILNQRLKSLTLGALLPSSNVVYSERHYVGSIDDVIHQVESEWMSKVAPPPAVLAQIFGVIHKQSTLHDPESYTYLFKRATMLGIPYCVGWMVVPHPLKGGAKPYEKPLQPGEVSRPETGYSVIAPCTQAKYDAITANQLPFPIPSPAAAVPARPQAGASPGAR